jgi:hypothetical protein
MNRRALMVSAPLALVAIGQPADAQKLTPVMRELQEHGRVVENLWSVEHAIRALPWAAVDWIAKVIANTCFGDFKLDSKLVDPGFWDEAERFVGGVRG